jgi:hypothetical protein
LGVFEFIFVVEGLLGACLSFLLVGESTHGISESIHVSASVFVMRSGMAWCGLVFMILPWALIWSHLAMVGMCSFSPFERYFILASVA